MQKFDVVVIGSGLGGLSCGATLSKSGKKILVLEQHSLIGGCATCFPRKGMMVDAGLHELDFGTRDRDMKHHIFDVLGLWDKIKLVPLPTAWTIQSQSEKFIIPHGNTQEVLKKMFPYEAEGIDKYFKKIDFQAKIAKKFPFDMKFLEFFIAPITTVIFLTYNVIRNKTAGEVLDECIRDSKLKRILNINLVYYHYDPYKFIWSYHAIPQKGYYTQGMYVKGGSQALSNGFASIITENGGEVRAKADVTKILLDGNKAVGVRYFDKNTKEEVEVYADKIVANCDPMIVYSELLPQDRSYEKDLRLTRDFETETSLLSIYMIFEKNLSEIYPDMDYSTFILDDKELNKDFKDSSYAKLDYKDMGFVFVNYSKIDSGLSDRDDRFLGVITTFARYDDWNLEKEEYKAKKEELKAFFEKRLEETFPGIMQYCIHSELATPKTIQRYIRTRKGTPYGYDQNKEGFMGRERYDSKSVKNLYFASAFGFPGGGFTGAILSGYRTAKKILNPWGLTKKIALCVFFGFAVVEIIKFIAGLFF
ncbi:MULTISPECIES: phytoene desaturase family protein [unclassified Helicobacter]|uniref:phytoene desaturase family protein n=1 Tax=unclassified Helicobacter TaxID=2593540 RepID=UPI000CF026B3|nr:MULTISPECIES: NAD(P)/FAD-dependent oxidoreductase [unclassified Helicobacter]